MPKKSNLYVNASLIHEIRMLIRHFFEAREAEAFWSRNKKAAAPQLKCAFCYLLKRPRQKDAVVVINGQSVCDEHAYYVKDDQLLKLLRIAGEDIRG
jgi:hypothetical protein